MSGKVEKTYAVKGAEMTTGKDRTVNVRAVDEVEAARIVNEMGVVVSSVSQVADHAAKRKSRSGARRLGDGLLMAGKAIVAPNPSKTRKRLKSARFPGMDLSGGLLFIGGFVPAGFGLWLIFTTDNGMGDFIAGGAFVTAGVIISSTGAILAALATIATALSKTLTRIADALEDTHQR